MSPLAIDRGKLDEQTFGDPGIREEVLRMFQAELPALLQAVAATSGAARAATAHRLKGSALAIGADRLAGAAAAVDAAPDAAERLSELETEAYAVQAEIAILLAS